MLDLITLLTVILVGLKIFREVQRFRLDVQRIELLVLESQVDEVTPK